jgi:hypothetical protein
MEPSSCTPRYETWIPGEGAEGWFVIEALLDDWEGLRVLLRPESQPDSRVLRLTFHRCIAYSSVDESYRLRTWSSDTYKPSGSFLRVHGSAMIEATVRESGEILDASELEHLAIYTIGQCLDFIVREEPRCEWL